MKVILKGMLTQDERKRVKAALKVSRMDSAMLQAKNQERRRLDRLEESARRDSISRGWDLEDE